MYNRKSDEYVSTLLVARRELTNRSPRGREHEVSCEAGDDGTRSLEEGSDKQRLVVTL